MPSILPRIHPFALPFAVALAVAAMAAPAAAQMQERTVTNPYGFDQPAGQAQQPRSHWNAMGAAGQFRAGGAYGTDVNNAGRFYSNTRSLGLNTSRPAERPPQRNLAPPKPR